MAWSWVSYPAYTIQANDHLRTKIGLRFNCGTGNVKFQIRYIEGQTEVTVGEWTEKCEGGLSSLDVNLSALVGHTVQFELVVTGERCHGPMITLCGWHRRIER